MKNFFDDSSILITGGTGSIGRELLNFLLMQTNVKRVAVFSRDELKQLQLKEQYRSDGRVRFFIGDIRDQPRLKLALSGVDYVIHTAALKQVDTGEYNPMEFVKTNILGSQNLIDAAMESGVKRVIALSTDKASSPINLYGATKLTADKLFIAANNYTFAKGSIFSVVRYGNVIGSRGSVIPFFKSLAEKKIPLPITDFRMTRFWIEIDQAVKFILESLEIMEGGELFVPRIPSMKIIDLARAISKDGNLVEVGLRPGEKLHEELVSSDDGRRTIILGNRFIIKPVFAEWGYKDPIGTLLGDGNSYRSDTNDLWLAHDEIEQIVSRC
jgi:UDP-N-acetylglucosamine 4,6-dehydratase